MSPKRNNPGCNCCGYSVYCGRKVGDPSGTAHVISHFVGPDTPTSGNWDWDYSPGGLADSCRCLKGTHNDRIVGAVVISGGTDIHTIAQADGAAVSSFSLTSNFGGLIHEVDSMCTDSAGNIYLYYPRTLQKYNSTGTRQWEKNVTTGGPGGDDGHRIDCDDVGTLVITGGTGTLAAEDYLRCYNSAGTQQWAKTGIAGSFYSYPAISPDGYVYQSGHEPGAFRLRKYSLVTGTEVTAGSWPLTTAAFVRCIHTDSDSNVYTVAYGGGGHVRKYNSSGVQQWATSETNDGATRGGIDGSGRMAVHIGSALGKFDLFNGTTGAITPITFNSTSGYARRICVIPGLCGAWS